jgi:DNA-binding transcriptional LysR family regulator
MSADQLPYLETFVKAAELSSFTAAAKVMNVTQAAISQRIHALEQNLGMPLFRREGGHVLLTEAGQRLYPHAQRILLLHQEARQAVTGQKAPLVGELALAASSIPGTHLLPALLADFRGKYPHIQVKVTVTDTQEVLDQAEHGRCNLALVGGKNDSPHLVFHPFTSDHMVLIVPPGHPWEKRKQVSLEDLCQQPLILREPGSGSRWCLEQALKEARRDFHDLTIALEFGSNESIKEAVMRGMGVAILSSHAVKKEIQAGQLRGLKVAGLPLVREIFVVWDRRRALSIPSQLFLDFLKSGNADS